MRRAPRWVLGAAVAAAGLTAAGASRADITVNTPINGPVHNGLISFMSKKDCLDDLSLTFPLGGIAPTLPNLEIWVAKAASPSCFDAIVRTPVTGISPCRQVFPTKQSSGQVTLSIKDIVTQINDLVMPGAQLPACSSIPALNGQQVSTYIYFVDTTSTNDGTTTTGTSTSTGLSPSAPAANPWLGYVDLAGPPPPTNLKLAPGNGLLLFSYDSSANSDVVQFRVYCSQNTGQAGVTSSATTGSSTASAGASTSSGSASSAAATSSGSTSSSAAATSSGMGGMGGSGGSGGSGGMGGGGGMGGMSGTTTTTTTTTTTATTGTSTTTTTTTGTGGADGGAFDPSCVLPANLVAGQIPPDDVKPCEVEPYGTAAIAVGKTDRLLNNQSYAVAIAGIDKVGNIGPLSAPLCGVPQETEDFFSAYREAGGQAGGGCGLCSIGEPRGFSTAALAGTTLIALAFGVRRKRRADRSRRGDR